jgi:hypothetical protein
MRDVTYNHDLFIAQSLLQKIYSKLLFSEEKCAMWLFTLKGLLMSLFNTNFDGCRTDTQTGITNYSNPGISKIR